MKTKMKSNRLFDNGKSYVTKGALSIIKLLCFLFYISIFASCTPVLYSPTSQNVPLLKEKGEVNFGGGKSTTDDADGVSVNLAVAVDSSWAIASSFTSLKGGTSSSSDLWYGNAKYIEAAVGKFGSSENGIWIYEAFLGMGYASVKNSKGNSVTNGKFIKPYLQPSFGVRTKIIDFAFTPRIAVVNYLSDDVSISTPEEQRSATQFFEDKSTSLVFEPGITLRLGLRNVKLYAQYVYSSFSYSSGDSDPFNREMFTLGLNFYVK